MRNRDYQIIMKILSEITAYKYQIITYLKPRRLAPLMLYFKK